MNCQVNFMNSLNGDVYRVFTERSKTDESETISAEKFMFDPSSSTFSSGTPLSFLQEGTKCQTLRIVGHLVSSSTVISTRTGMRNLYIAFSSYEKFTIYQLSKADCFVEYSCSVLPSGGNLSFNFDLSGVFWVDGPGVLWVSDGGIHIIHGHSDSNKAGIMTVPHEHICKPKPSKLWCGELHNKLIVVGVSENQPKMNTEENNLKLFAMEFSPVAIEGKECFNMEGSDFVPQDYAGILTSIHVEVKLKKNTSLYSCRHEDEAPKRYSNKTLIFTSYKQLIEFHDGQMIHCLDTEIVQVQSLHMFEGFGGNLYIVLQSADEDVTVIERDDFQVRRKFSRMKFAVTDDFLGCGTEQLLLIPDGTTPVTNFILTDLMLHHLDSNQPTALGKDGHSVNMEAGITALKARLQAAQLSLMELEGECQKKSEIMRSCFSAVQSITLNTGPQSKPEGSLVPLLGSHGPGSSEAAARLSPHQASLPRHSVQVLDTWHRIVEDKLVVGVELLNAGHSTLSNIHLSLFTHDAALPSVESSCKTSQTERQGMTAEITDRPVKKAKLVPQFQNPTISDTSLRPEQRTTRVSTCNLPLFHVNELVRVGLVLHWEEHLGEVTECKTDPERLSRGCGHVTLSTQDVISGKIQATFSNNQEDLSELEVQRHLLAWNAVQESLALSVTSGRCMTGFTHMLESCLAYAYSATYKCHIQLRPGPMQDSRIQVRHVERDSVNIIVHARDERQLLLVVRSLYRFLPDDAQILPARNETTETSIQKALKAIQTEIKSISASISGSASAFQGTDYQGGGGDAPFRHTQLPTTTALGDTPFQHRELPPTTTLGDIERKTDLAIGALAL